MSCGVATHAINRYAYRISRIVSLMFALYSVHPLYVLYILYSIYSTLLCTLPYLHIFWLRSDYNNFGLFLVRSCIHT